MTDYDKTSVITSLHECNDPVFEIRDLSNEDLDCHFVRFYPNKKHSNSHVVFHVNDEQALVNLKNAFLAEWKMFERGRTR